MKVRTIKEAKAEHAKKLKKEIEKIEKFMYNPDCDGSFYSSRYTSEWWQLPDIAQKAIQEQYYDMRRELHSLETTSDDVYNTMLDVLKKVYKFYGVEKELDEIRNRYRRQNNGKDFEESLSSMANCIWEKVDRKGRY